MPPLFWTLGCVYGASSVMLGAFGAHGLKNLKHIEPSKIASWNTAAHYQASPINEMIPWNNRTDRLFR